VQRCAEQRGGAGRTAAPCRAEGASQRKKERRDEGKGRREKGKCVKRKKIGKGERKRGERVRKKLEKT
jgi:hypothetical protein